MISNQKFSLLLKRNEEENNKNKLILFNTIIQELNLEADFSERKLKQLANKFLSNALLSKFKNDYELETLQKFEENLLVLRIKEDHEQYVHKAMKRCLANNSLTKRLDYMCILFVLL